MEGNLEGDRTASSERYFSQPAQQMQYAEMTPGFSDAFFSTPESLASHAYSNFDWRPPTQITPISDDPNLPDKSFQNDFGDYEAFLQTRDLVASWSRYWTGMEQWPEALDAAFQRHKQYGPEGVHTFIRKLWYHEQRGRQLLHRIQSRRSGDSLPSNPEALMALWNLQQDQVMVLTRGLTIMELTGSIARRSSFSVGGGELADTIPSTILARNTPLYPPKAHNRETDRETEQDEEDVERFLISSQY